MTANSNWVILTFANPDDEDKVELLPKIWLSEDKQIAWYPPYKDDENKLMKAILSKIPPGEDWDWVYVDRIITEAGNF